MINQNKIQKISVFAGYSKTSRILSKKITQYFNNAGFKIIPLDNNEHPELIVVCGGDGTLLYATKTLNNLRAPLLGLNTGQVGFLMNDLKNNEKFLKTLVQKIKKNKFEIKSYPLISCKTDKKHLLVFNDLALLSSSDKTARFQTVRLDMYLDKTKLIRYSGDGLIVSSPIGSTAYSLSARGPAVHHDVRCLLITPNNPHPAAQFRSLLFPLVLPPKTKIKISVVGHKKRPVRLVADGADLGLVQEIIVTTSRESIRLAHLENNYIKNLAKKIINPLS